VNLRRGSQVFTNQELRGMGSQSSGPVHFHFPGVTDPKSAREAAGQAARRYRRDINGPVSRAA
jgi:hypothetical protein